MTEKTQWQSVPSKLIDELRALLIIAEDGKCSPELIGLRFRNTSQTFEILLSAAAPSPPPSAAVTDGMVEAAGEAIWKRQRDALPKESLRSITPWRSETVPNKLWDGYADDARAALQAALAVAPQGHGGEG